jgi:outer membrane protein assembly factor BamB
MGAGVIRRGLWLAVVPLLVIGCSNAGGHSSAVSKASAAPAHTKPPVGWVRTDLTPLTMPQLAGGRLVLYVEGGGGIQVVGLDPLTGKTAWREDASPGATTPGVMPALGVAGSAVVFISPVGSSPRSTELVGVDAVTGRRLWHTPAGAFEDWPVPCPDAARDICTSGSLGSAQETLALRFRASDGTRVGAVAVAQSAGGRSIGPDLYDPGVRDPEAMAAVSGDSLSWVKPLASVFSQEDSTDYGWNFMRVPTVGLFVGSVGGPPVSVTATKAIFGLARGGTAGFRISDGSAAWQDPGTWFACGQLPCPGQGLVGGIPTMGLRLRATGTVTSDLSTGALTMSPGGTVTIEGFDLATGKTIWSYDAGSNVGLLDGQLPPVMGSEVVALPAKSSGDMVALNLATGKHAPVSPTAAGWCASSVRYKTQVPYPKPGGGSQYEREASSGYEPCDASGDSVSSPAKVPSFAGITVDGLTVTSDSSEVAATPTVPLPHPLRGQVGRAVVEPITWLYLCLTAWMIGTAMKPAPARTASRDNHPPRKVSMSATLGSAGS